MIDLVSTAWWRIEYDLELPLIVKKLDFANLDWTIALESADIRKLTEAKLQSRNTEVKNYADIILILEF